MCSTHVNLPFFLHLPTHLLSLLSASLGNISPFTNFTNLDQVNSYLSFNVSSPLALTAGILQVFPPRAGLRWSVVNCSSIFAVETMPSWVMYCTGKSARVMMFRVLAAEEPNVKVLSYSPGMCNLLYQPGGQKYML